MLTTLGRERAGLASRGILLMAASAALFSVMAVCVKLGGRTMPTSTLVFARTALALALVSAALWRRRLSPWRGVPVGLLLMRGALGFIGLACFFWSITHLPLADATVIMYANPLLVVALAALWLGERIGAREVCGIALSLCGVAAIARPSFLFGHGPALDPRAVAIALGGACAAACAYTTVRALAERAPALVIVFYFPLVSAPLALAWAWPALSWPSATEWALLLGIGVSTHYAQLLMTRGFALESAARASSVTYLQVVFAFGWGIALFDEVPRSSSILGALLVIGGALIALRRRRALAAQSAPPSELSDERA